MPKKRLWRRLEAAHGGEAVALAQRRRDGGRPVGLDAERRGLDREALLPGREDDRHARDRGEAALEQGSRLGLGQPADVDAGDRDPLGHPRGRAGEDEPDERREHREQASDDQQPAGDQRARPPSAAGALTDVASRRRAVECSRGFASFVAINLR